MDRIDYNMDQSLNNMKDANVNLEKAEEYQKKVMMMMVVVIVVVIVVVVVVVVVVWTIWEEMWYDKSIN